MKKYCFLSCADVQHGGGVYYYSLIENQLVKEQYYPCDAPMFCAYNDSSLQVLLKHPFNDACESGIFSLTNSLTNPTEIQSTNGIVACHLCTNSHGTYLVNYLSGNVVHLNHEMDQHEGKGPNPDRQEAPHTHFVMSSPDEKYILVCDLGLDTLFVYTPNLKLVSKAKVPDGYGIRHFVFSKNGKYIYAVNELVSSISVFSFENGIATLLSTTKLDVIEPAKAAAIRLSSDEKYLYVSSRWDDSIFVYEVKESQLKFLQKCPSGGKSPRDIWVDDEYLYVCNEDSNNIALFELDHHLIGKQLQSVPCNGVLCVIPVQE